MNLSSPNLAPCPAGSANGAPLIMSVDISPAMLAEMAKAAGLMDWTTGYCHDGQCPKIHARVFDAHRHTERWQGATQALQFIPSDVGGDLPPLAYLAAGDHGYARTESWARFIAAASPANVAVLCRQLRMQELALDAVLMLVWPNRLYLDERLAHRGWRVRSARAAAITRRSSRR